MSLLAIDIGNTSINNAIFSGKRIQKKWRIEIEKDNLSLNIIYHEYSKILHKQEIKKVIIVSVVPKLTNVFVRLMKKRFKLKTYIIGKDIIVPIKNLYKNPKQVGQDRLVNAYSGLKLYGGGLIIIDFGTAITFDIISKRGWYLGGLITPGLKISLDALNKRTALLPEIKIKTPERVIGRDTASSMRSGIIYGYGCLCDGLVRKLKSVTAKEYKVIITGGFSRLMSKFCKSYDILNPDLTIQGLWFLSNYLYSETKLKNV